MGWFLLFKVVPFALVGLVALIGWWTSRRRAIWRALRDAELVSIGDYPDGGVKRIVGELALLDDALTAPLSGRRCAAYEVVIEARGKAGMEQVAHEVRCVAFAVRDPTGRAIVRPEHASVAITLDSNSTSSWSDDPTPQEEELLRRLAAHMLGSLINPSLSYREGVLDAGEQVAVLGHGLFSLDEEADGPAGHEGGYRVAAGRKKLTIVGSPEHPVFISDDPSVLLDPKALRPPIDVRG